MALVAAGPRAVALDRAALWRDLRDAFADDAAFAAVQDGRTGLISDYGVALPPGAVPAIAAAVAALHDAVNAPDLRRAQLAANGWPGDAAPHAGPLCFDFHLTADGPRLIEINTNPGGLLIAAALARAAGQAADVEGAALAFAGGGSRVAIVDETPPSQFLWPEFLLYQALFRRAGLTAEIHDAAGFDPAGFDAIYNRLTDFRLERPEHAALAQAWRTGKVVLTPDPFAHAALSDKRLLVELSRRSPLVPPTRVMTEDDWDRRRHLFFKPMRGHAAKAVYRGDKISRATWDNLPRGATIAQDYVPPSRLEVPGAELGAEPLKCDLRAFALDGRLVLLTARLYRGQATNFRTPGGGFAPILA